MVGVKTSKTSNYVPVSTLGVDSKILDLKLKVMSTPEGAICLNHEEPIEN